MFNTLHTLSLSLSSSRGFHVLGFTLVAALSAGCAVDELDTAEDTAAWLDEEDMDDADEALSEEFSYEDAHARYTTWVDTTTGTTCVLGTACHVYTTIDVGFGGFDQCLEGTYKVQDGRCACKIGTYTWTAGVSGGPCDDDVIVP